MTRPAASVGFILATLAIDALGFGMIIPIVPNLVVEVSGLPPSAASFWLGALLAAFSGMQFVCAPVLGALGDRFGRRPVLLLSLSGIGASQLLLAWAPSLTWLFVARLIAGATAANGATANAYISDITPPEQRARRFGLAGAMFGLGFVAGPAIGGFLGHYDLRLPFLVAAGLTAVNIAYGALVLPESLPPESRSPFRWRKANPVGSLRAIAADRSYTLLAIAWCCAWGAIGTLPSSFVLVNQVRFDWGPRENGMALAVVGVGAALVQGLLVRPIINRLGERHAALLAYVLAGSAYLCFGLAGAGWVVYLGIVLQAFGAVGGPAAQAMISARAGRERQGAVQGALSSLQGLSAIVSPLAAGWLFGVFGAPDAPIHLPGAPFLLAALLVVVAFACIRGLRETEPSDLSDHA